MNTLTKKIWFDENSQPPKNMIWYRGAGKFYEWKNEEWVVAYDLNNMPTQEEQEELVAAIQEKNPEFVVDESKSLLPQVLSEILNLATSGPEIPHAIQLSGSPETSMTTPEALAEIGLTRSEIEAAGKGERTGVITEGSFFPILLAMATGSVYRFCFGSIGFGDSGVDSWMIWDIEIPGDYAIVRYYEA